MIKSNLKSKFLTTSPGLKEKQLNISYCQENPKESSKNKPK